MREMFVYDAATYCGVREAPGDAAAKLGEVLARAPLGTHGTVRRAYLTNLHGGPYRYGPVLVKVWRDKSSGDVRFRWSTPEESAPPRHSGTNPY